MSEEQHVLPFEIRKVQEDTQKIEDALFKKEPPKKEEPKKEEPPVKEEPSKEPPVEEPPKEEVPAEELPKEEEPPREEPPKEEPGKPVDWEHKYRVIDGKYKKELPREREARKAAEDRTISVEYENSELRKQVADLTGKLETGKPVSANAEIDKIPKTVQTALDELDSDSEVQLIKNEFPAVWKALKKTLAKASEAILQGATEKVSRVEKKIEVSEEEIRRTNWNAFHKYLDDNVSGWRVVNKDPGFSEALQEVDEYSGKTKKALIDDAIHQMDGKRVAKFFLDYAKSKKPPEPKKEAPKDETVEDGEKIPAKPADVNPPKSRKNPPPAKPDDKNKQIITTEHITKFYEDKRRGAYLGREAEFLAEEKKIELAVVEGRVR
jgi:hypothetical protein